MSFIRTLLLSGGVILCFLRPAYAVDLGVVGKVYAIVEPDALEEIQKRVQAIHWETVLSTKTDISTYRPKDLRVLPTATMDRAFSVDLTYVVPEDIRDQYGQVVYPKGYAFNPLEAVSLPNTLVFLNGKDPLQKKWFRSSPYFEDISVMIILSDGDLFKLSESLDRPLYYLTDELASRLNLSVVPSVVKQRGKHLEVREIAIKD